MDEGAVACALTILGAAAARMLVVPHIAITGGVSSHALLESADAERVRLQLIEIEAEPPWRRNMWSVREMANSMPDHNATKRHLILAATACMRRHLYWDSSPEALSSQSVSLSPHGFEYQRIGQIRCVFGSLIKVYATAVANALNMHRSHPISDLFDQLQTARALSDVFAVYTRALSPSGINPRPTRIASHYVNATMLAHPIRPDRDLGSDMWAREILSRSLRPLNACSRFRTVGELHEFVRAPRLQRMVLAEDLDNPYEGLYEPFEVVVTPQKAALYCVLNFACEIATDVMIDTLLADPAALTHPMRDMLEIAPGDEIPIGRRHIMRKHAFLRLVRWEPNFDAKRTVAIRLALLHAESIATHKEDDLSPPEHIEFDIVDIRDDVLQRDAANTLGGLIDSCLRLHSPASARQIVMRKNESFEIIVGDRLSDEEAWHIAVNVPSLPFDELFVDGRIVPEPENGIWSQLLPVQGAPIQEGELEKRYFGMWFRWKSDLDLDTARVGPMWKHDDRKSWGVECRPLTKDEWNLLVPSSIDVVQVRHRHLTRSIPAGEATVRRVLGAFRQMEIEMPELSPTLCQSLFLKQGAQVPEGPQWYYSMIPDEP